MLLLFLFLNNLELFEVCSSIELYKTQNSHYLGLSYLKFKFNYGTQEMLQVKGHYKNSLYLTVNLIKKKMCLALKL